MFCWFKSSQCYTTLLVCLQERIHVAVCCSVPIAPQDADGSTLQFQEVPAYLSEGANIIALPQVQL